MLFKILQAMKTTVLQYNSTVLHTNWQLLGGPFLRQYPTVYFHCTFCTYRTVRQSLMYCSTYSQVSAIFRNGTGQRSVRSLDYSTLWNNRETITKMRTNTFYLRVQGPYQQTTRRTVQQGAPKEQQAGALSKKSTGTAQTGTSVQKWGSQDQPMPVE